MFDPLGLFLPVLLKGKLLLQSLWSKGHDWDDEISSGDLNVWCSIKLDLSKLSDFEVKSCINMNGRISKNYLLCFCNASVHAYAVAFYIYQAKAKSECKSRKENPRKLTQLSSRSHPRHLVGKRTAQKDITIDTTSDSQVNSNFPNRWSPASLSLIFCFLKPD